MNSIELFLWLLISAAFLSFQRPQAGVGQSCSVCIGSNSEILAPDVLLWALADSLSSVAAQFEPLGVPVAISMKNCA